MPLITWLKAQSTRRKKKKLYTSFRTEHSPPPLSRKNAPHLNTPNYTSSSSPHPPSRPVSPRTTLYRTSEPVPAIFSKGTSSISSGTVSPLTPPESFRSEAQSWISCSESSLRGNGGSDIRLHRNGAGIESVALSERTPKRSKTPGGGRGRNSGVIPTPPQTPPPPFSKHCNDDAGDEDDDDAHHHDDHYGNGDAYVYVPILPDSDTFYPLAGRKEELVELFTLHGPVYGEEWRLRGTYDKTKRSRARVAAEDIESANEELMNGYSSGDGGYSEMWTRLERRGLIDFDGDEGD